MLNVYSILGGLWGVLILVLTLTPGKSMPDLALFSYDKLGHAGMFAILVFLILMGFTKHKGEMNHSRKSVVIIIALAAVYGALIEVIQSFIPGRGLEFGDGIANMVGCILGFVGYYITNIFFKALKKSKI